MFGIEYTNEGSEKSKHAKGIVKFWMDIPYPVNDIYRIGTQHNQLQK